MENSMPNDNSIPEKYRCSITLKIMIDPVVAADGHTYEREAIEEWLKSHDTSPKTNLKLKHRELTENHDKHSDILEFLGEHPELYAGDEIYLPKSWAAQLTIALKNNDPPSVQRWLDKDRRLLTLKLENDATALHLACEFSSPPLVERLLKIFNQRNQIPLPGSVDFKPDFLNILLEYALKGGEYAKCALLLKLGASLEQPEISTQNTLLHRMVIVGNQEAVAWLLDQKAKLEGRNAAGNTPLLLSIIHHHTKLSSFLLSRQANLQVKNLDQQSPILIALLNSNHAILRNLVGEQKAALSPLHLGLALEDNHMIKALITEKIGDIEAIDEQQRTPFYCAIESGNLDAARLFLSANAVPTISCGKTQLNVLHIATIHGDADSLKYLLQTKAVELIDTQTAEGDTSLHLAVRVGKEEIVSLLLAAGAYPKIKNTEDLTAIELARVQQKSNIANLIIQTVRTQKKAKLKEIDRLRQVVSAQASEIAILEKQAEIFKTQLSTIEHALNEKRTKHENLPENMLQSIETQVKQLRFMPLEAVLPCGPASPNSVAFHINSTNAPASNEKEVEEFLRLVAEGEQDKAEAMLKKNPTLALISGNVTDLSKRTFKDITAFQYAVWALDWHMWEMIRKYLPDEAAKEQAEGFETGDWIKSHGIHAQYLLDNLVKALQNTIDLYGAKKFPECNNTWVNQAGGAQLLLPAHVINEYCHPTRSFYPLPNFRDTAVIPRTRKVDEGEWFGKLTGKIVYCRANVPCMHVLAWGEFGGEVLPELVSMDRDSISAISVIRTAQREELIGELRPKNFIRKIEDLKELEEFLRLVAEGEQDKAEATLKKNPNLALVPGDITDLSKRAFNNITGFQYAMWALDWHMWTMIQKYLPDDQAIKQAAEFETGAWIKNHGTDAKWIFDELLKAYGVTISLYDQKKWKESEAAWMQQVGSVQLLLPAHVINEYCHPTRPFYPIPNFKSSDPLPRSREIDVGEWFTATYKGGKLGAACPHVGGIDDGRAGSARFNGLGHSGRRMCVGMDFSSIHALYSVRTSQYEELIAKLRIKPLQRKIA